MLHVISVLLFNSEALGWRYIEVGRETMSRLCGVMGCVLGMLLFGQGVAQAAVPKTIEAPRLVVQAGHSSNVTSVAFSPDGKTVVSGSEDNTLKLWNVATGKELRTLSGHSSVVSSVAFSPDGKTVLSGSRDNTLKLWDVVTGKELRSFRGHINEITSVAYSPNGKTVLSGSAGRLLKLWDVTTGKELRSFYGHTNAVTSVTYAPDGKTVLSGSWDSSLRLWDVQSGKELRSFRGHKNSVESVAYAPDGKTVLSGSVDGTLKLWDVETGAELHSFSGHSGRVYSWVNSVAYSPDGRMVLSGSADETLKLWDIATGKELRTLFVKHPPWVSMNVTSVAYSPDGRTVLSGSEDKTLRLWDVATGRVLRSLSGNSSTTISVAYAPDGRAVLSGSQPHNILWDMTLGPKQDTANVGSRSVAFAPDGNTLMTDLKLWDAAMGKVLHSFDAHTREVSSVAYALDGKTIVSGSGDKTLKLWDIATGAELRTLSGHSDWIASVAYAPDGKTVLSGSYDKTLKLWDVATGEVLRSYSGHANSVLAVTYAPDGKTLLSGSLDGTLKLWSLANGQVVRTFEGHVPITTVAFSPDGKTVVSGSWASTLKLWDVATGKELRSMSGHSGWVAGVVFSPDGKTILSGGQDGTLKLWRVSDGALLATLISFSDGRWAVTDPEGRFDVADLEDMPHLHWVMPDDPLTPLPLEIFMRDYYEPRLLARIMNGEKFKPVRALGELNRVQPEVKITGIEPDSEPGYVKVAVEANGVSRAYGFSDRKIATAAHDLRLFRNGQLVGYAEGKLAEAGGKPFQRTFRVRLPSGQTPLNFTAYAFNDDRVKSATAQQSYTPPTAIAIGKPRAYLITVGVNRHDNPAWNLRYAANDARQISQSLAPLLINQKSYEEVVTIPLISDADGPNLATKANIKTVLDVLSGRKADVSAIPGGDKLRQATPDDLVLISFSGHGFGEGGLFYLIPSDTGTGSDREISPALTAHAISSDELSAWLRDVDAGNMAMIVDACHSAASVGDEFKPGPMGSRGLGQLAFDKGMRILAASQADDVALESDLIKQGLLSFALVENGLEGKQADFKPKDKKITLEEWLSYGVSRVPSLAEEVKTGKVVASRGAVRTFSGELKKKRAIQQPALFDFTKGRRDAVLETGLR